MKLTVIEEALVILLEREHEQLAQEISLADSESYAAEHLNTKYEKVGSALYELQVVISDSTGN